MSFGLKNAGATYQRTIQACFKRQLNKNVEAYVDGVVIKTRNSNTLIADLEESFASLREYSWKLNPNKCVFGVPSENYSASSSATAVLMPIPRRSPPSPA
jgi:hypothetical protein